MPRRAFCTRTWRLGVIQSIQRPAQRPLQEKGIIRADNANQIHPLAHLGLGFLTRVTWSPHGKTLAVGIGAGIWMYSMNDLHTTPRLIGDYSGDVSSVAFSPDGKLIASASDSDTTVRLWNVATGKLLRTLNGHTNEVTSVAFSPNGKLLANDKRQAASDSWQRCGQCNQRYIQPRWQDTCIWQLQFKYTPVGCGEWHTAPNPRRP